MRCCSLALLVSTALFTALACGDVPIPQEAESASPEGAGETRADAPSRPSTSPIGEGFLVWESNRTGEWRIWTRRLEGGEARQLVPDEPGSQHYCPHISPDGRHLAYLSSRHSGNRYPAGGMLGALHLLELDTGADRVVARRARTYFENRAVVWRSPFELIFIDQKRRTRLLDLNTGEARLLTTESGEPHGFLIDAQLSHASQNDPTFSILDQERRRIVPRPALGGCQSYFTHDGRWGVWMAGAGGPIEKLDLVSRQRSRILGKNDPLLPEGLGYLYFPMPSRDGHLLAFAASRSDHDHFTSDYEVFVIETDPETLEPFGAPVRFTSNAATDRYPDVFLEPIELGRLRGEAPFEIELTAPGEGPWSWSMADLAPSTGRTVRHRFERPGRYRIEARSADRTLRGQVIVVPAAPPRAVVNRLSGDARTLHIEFDESIRPTGLAIRFDSGRAVARWSLSADSRRLDIELTEAFEGIDRLRLTGIEDLAQHPNRMPETILDIGPPHWPVRSEGLVFVWQTGDSPNLVPDPQTGVDRSMTLEAVGQARLDHHWAMLPGSGRFRAQAPDAARVSRALKSSNELTLELTLTPGRSTDEVDLVALADRVQNFRLRTIGGQVVFTLRAAGRGSDAPSKVLFPLPPAQPSHVVVTYSPARLTAYLNGEKRLELGAADIRGDFYHWDDRALTFGGARMEGVAIYDRVLDAGEVEANYERYRSLLIGRSTVVQLTVDARLERRTAAPGLDEISPYREALVIYEYELLGRVVGKPPSTRVRVAHWAILDAERTPINDRREGQVYRMKLETFAANPQLASLFLGEDAGIDTRLPLYYQSDAGN